MKKLILILLLIPVICSAQYRLNNGINQSDGIQFVRNTAVELPIQKLDGIILADGITLNDTSGNNRDAKLVNSFFASYCTGIPAVSTSPTTEGYTCKDFSVSFIIRGGGGMYSSIVTRTNGGGFAGFISTILINPSGELYYYSSNGSSYSGTKIKTLISTVIYRCSIKVNSTGGSLSWVINDTAGRAPFTNYTPSTALSGDAFYYFNNIAGNYYFPGNVADLKFYSDTLYSNLTHWYPFAEGAGKTFYDVVGTAHLTSTGTPSWADRQNYFHYNWRYGFELYGNDTAIIRVPYKSSGDKITPTINAYTKYADCPAGKYNNYAETGIKRNPTNDSVLVNRGIDSSNVVYFMKVTGNDSLSFCSNWSGLETNWSVYAAKRDRRTTFAVPTGARYLRDSAIIRIVGNSGVRTNTKLKYAFNKSTTATTYYDFYLKDTIYSEYNLTIPEYCGLVGQSKAGTIVRGRQPTNVALDSVNINSTLNAVIGAFRLSNLTVTAQNMRYCIHADGTSKIHTRYLANVNMIHFGNGEWTSANSQDSIYRDAYGSGTYPGTYTYVEDSYFEGTYRGYAQHGNTNANTSTSTTITIFRNCTFKSMRSAYSFRYSPELSNVRDSVCFYGCNFNSQLAYVDNAPIYTLLADHVAMYSNNSLPPIYYVGEMYTEAIKFSSGTIAPSATTTLIMGTLNGSIGTKNITDYNAVTGYKSIGYYLGDCSSSNKTMTIEGQTITFNQNHTAQSNSTIISFINAQLSGITASKYYYLSNLTLRPL